MTNHNVYIAEDHHGDYCYRSATSSAYADIIVEPPINPADGFTTIVLGHNPLDISLQHEFSTSEATVFSARVGGERDHHERHLAFQGLIARITRLADDPKQVSRMRDEIPFLNRVNLIFGYTGKI